MAEFKAGDTVQLKSGGPVMTVSGESAIGAGKLNVQWFDSKNVLQQGTFRPEELAPFTVTSPGVY